MAGHSDRPRCRCRVHRYYDPATDQFLSIDPAVATTGQPYVFTGDNPLNATDPTGFAMWCMQGTSHNYTGNLYANLYGANNGPCGFGEYGDSCFYGDTTCEDTAFFNSPGEAAKWDDFMHQLAVERERKLEEALNEYTTNQPFHINPTLVSIASTLNSVATQAERAVPILHTIGDCAVGANNFWSDEAGGKLLAGEGAVFALSWYFPIEPEAQGALVIGGGALYGCADGVYAGG